MRMRLVAKAYEHGSYALPNVLIGQYSLEISMICFSTYTQSGLTLQINSNPTINVELAVGTVSQQVEVHADVSLVEGRSTGVGQVIENRRVLELPLNGRQATELVLLTGGAVPAPPAAFQSSRNYPTLTIPVPGGSPPSFFLVMDGVC